MSLLGLMTAGQDKPTGRSLWVCQGVFTALSGSTCVVLACCAERGLIPAGVWSESHPMLFFISRTFLAFCRMTVTEWEFLE